MFSGLSDAFLPIRQGLPMGDCPTEPLRPQFDRRLRLEFHGANVTSDAGLLAYRELDDALQLTDTAADVLQDTRTGRNTRHGLAALLRQSLFSRLAGYEDLNDAQRLRVDPAMRTVVGGRASALAYNLGDFLRQRALPPPVRTWTRTTLRAKLIKIGAKVVHHARAVTFQLAEVAVPRVLFAAILGRIGRLRAAPNPG